MSTIALTGRHFWGRIQTVQRVQRLQAAEHAGVGDLQVGKMTTHQSPGAGALFPESRCQCRLRCQLHRCCRFCCHRCQPAGQQTVKLAKSDSQTPPKANLCISIAVSRITGTTAGCSGTHRLQTAVLAASAIVGGACAAHSRRPTDGQHTGVSEGGCLAGSVAATCGRAEIMCMRCQSGVNPKPSAAPWPCWALPSLLPMLTL